MSNKQAKKTTSMIDENQSRIGTEHGQDRSYIQGAIGRESPFSTGLRDEILGGYRNLAAGKDVSGGAFSGGGGYSPQMIGLNPALAEMEGRYKGLSGGLDRALTGYDEFAKTGGVSDADRANIRSRGAETGSAIFGNLKNEIQRRNAVQGGYSPSMTGSMSRLAREQSIAAGKGARDTELDISNTVRQGRLAGLGGQERIGSTGYGGAMDIANIRQQIDEQNAAARNAAASAGAGAGLRAQMAGLGGLQEMYGASPGELSRYDDMLLRERGLTDSGIGGNLQNRTANVGQETSAWDRVMQGVNAASGLGAAFMTGGASTLIPRRGARK